VLTAAFLFLECWYGKIHSDEVGDIEEYYWFLKEDKRKMRAGGLSTGEQQLLAMGRALMQKPLFLLADEPTQGLSPAYVDIIFDKLLEINRTGTGSSWLSITPAWHWRLPTGVTFSR
jgi:ABC-type branched-subunit amino acid transport system ATPase component